MVRIAPTPPAGSRRRHLPGFRRTRALLRLLGRSAPLPGAPPVTTFSGLGHPVHTAFDARAVPRLTGATAADVLFAEGYLHGRERAFQMDVARRAAYGRLAALVGPGGLPFDRFTRRLGLAAIAQATPATWPEPVQRLVQAYVGGVNAAFTTLPTPTEHRLLKVPLEPWTAADTASVSFQLGWLLNDTWQTKWARHRLADRPEVWDWLYPANFPPARAVIVPGTGSARAAGALGGGSNNWVAAGRHTASGHPLLANDPHLPPQLPSVWYQVHLDAPDLAVWGVSLAGVPGVVIGQNSHLAWGVTNVDPDVQDLYRVVLDPDGQHYQVDGARHEIGVREEAISVRGAAPEPLTCRDTVWGPVVADDSAGNPVSLAWTGLAPSPLAGAILHLNQAHDWDSFNAALSDWWAPAQNFVYADRDGHIGYVMAGRIPVRGAAAESIADGNSRRHAWDGFVPFANAPRVLDPPSGFIVTANNPVVGLEAPTPVPGRFSQGDRAARIQHLLEATGPHTPQTFAAIQMDVHSDPLAALAQRLLAHPALPEPAAALLASFEGSTDPGQTAPTLLYLFCLAALPPAVRDGLDRPFFADLTPGPAGSHPFPERLWELLGDRLPALVLHHWDHLDVRGALEGALAEGARAFGPDMRGWTWARARRVRGAHLFGTVPRLAPAFLRPALDLGGDTTTPLQSVMSLAPDPWPRAVRIMPSYRQIVDPAEPAAALGVLAAGQSGHPLSPHYDDMTEAFLAGALWPMGPGMATASGFTLSPLDSR